MKTINNFKGFYLFLLLLTAGTVKAQECNMLIDVDFNNWADRTYSISDIKEDFNDKVKPWTASTYRGVRGPGASNNLIEDTPQVTKIVDGTLRAEYLKNDASGRSGGFLFDPYFDGVNEAYLEYKLKFDDNFFWATGGKLPGLGGSTEGINSESVGRGTIPSGKRYDVSGKGFSARLMWRRNRTQTDRPYLILYSYFAKKQNNTNRRDNENGDAYRLFTGLEDDKWYTIRQYIKLNTPGRDNGVVKMWIDGDLVMNNSQMNIRKTSNRNLKINALVMNTYRGGNRTDRVWQSPRTEYTFFDDFKVWTGCSEPEGGNDDSDNSSNQKPTVSLTSPSNGAVFELGETITLEANASDPDGNLEKVNFKINGDFYAIDTERPFKNTFTPERAGTYTIAAKAFDRDGLTFEKSVTVRVIAPTPENNNPTLSITSPVDQSVYELGETITLEANASDPDGNLEKVNFKINGDFYAIDTERPFKKTFSPSRTGTYIIGARAFDTDGLTAEKTVTIRVVAAGGDDTSNENSCNFGAPLNSGLPSFDRASFNNIHVLGNGGPNVDQIRRFKINWDASSNKLHQFAVNTKNGQPAYYVNLLDKMTYNFKNARPELTLTNSGLTGWDGSYWVVKDGDDFAMVSKNQNFTIYFNNGGAPSCGSRSSASFLTTESQTAITVFPSPATTYINVTGLENETGAAIVDIYGKTIIKTTLNQKNNKIDVSRCKQGIYFLKLMNNSKQETIRFIKS